MKRENLYSIAEQAGCSISTVSRVMNGNAIKYRISKATVSRVQEVINRANYTPNLLAKGLRVKRTDTIGLLIPNIDNSFFAHIASVVIREARSHRYKVVVVDTQENGANEKDGLSALLARRVDGIIAAPCGVNETMFANIQEEGIPIVFIDRFLPEAKQLSYVTTDNYRGAVMAMEYLVSNGHKSITCIQGTPHSMPIKDRVRGYMETMKRSGLEQFINVQGDDFSVQNGYLEAKLVLARENPPTAIFALSNLILLGVIKAVRESGLRIPDDISIVSFDDNLLFNYLDPAITCVSQPTEEIGTISVKLLIRAMHDAETSSSQLYLPPTLVIRRSVQNRYARH
jgi:LacI family transcriptional regulator